MRALRVELVIDSMSYIILSHPSVVVWNNGVSQIVPALKFHHFVRPRLLLNSLTME